MSIISRASMSTAPLAAQISVARAQIAAALDHGEGAALAKAGRRLDAAREARDAAQQALREVTAAAHRNAPGGLNVPTPAMQDAAAEVAVAERPP